MTSQGYACPDCDEPLTFAFRDTSGQGAHKRGDAFNTNPDTDHYLCVPCLKAWKQRLHGPLTPDVIGELAFFTCPVTECGARLELSPESAQPTDVELMCSRGHHYGLQASDDGSLALHPKS